MFIRLKEIQGESAPEQAVVSTQQLGLLTHVTSVCSPLEDCGTFPGQDRSNGHSKSLAQGDYPVHTGCVLMLAQLFYSLSSAQLCLKLHQNTDNITLTSDGPHCVGSVWSAGRCSGRGRGQPRARRGRANMAAVGRVPGTVI